MKLGEKISLSRKKQGLSQLDLADALGVSRQSISKWETEESKPDISKLPALAKVLHVSIDWLLSEDAEDNKEDSLCEKAFGNLEEAVKTYPDWIEKLPGFLGASIRKFGWIYGVKIIVSGVFLTIFGIVARVMSYRFIFGTFGNKTFGGNAFASPNVWSVEEPLNLGGGVFAEINNRAWTGFSTITGLMIGTGLILLIGGSILTVILKKWSKKA